MFTTATGDLICGNCVDARYRELELDITRERLPDELRARWTSGRDETCTDCQAMPRFGCQWNT